MSKTQDERSGQVDPWELTDKEYQSLVLEEARIKSATPVKFYPVLVNGEWKVTNDCPAGRVEGYTCFWGADAECAQHEGNQTRFEYALKMSKQTQEPVYDWRDFADEPQKEYPLY